MDSNKEIKVSEIAQAFGLTIEGDGNRVITGPGSLTKQNDSFVYWMKAPKYATRIPKGNIIISKEHFKDIEKQEGACYLLTEESPRLIYAQVLQKYFSHLGLVLSPNQVEMHRKNKNIIISDNVYIAENVIIGDGTIIHPNVVIHNGTVIGKKCVIKANCTLATEGLGYEKDSNNDWVKFPQLGGVEIGDNVEMGPSATIRRGALDNTIVMDNVKIGSFCNIGHNCIIGRNSILTCQCVTGGSSVLGDDVFMGIQAMVRNGTVVEANSKIGAGAVVIKKVDEGTTVVGSPAILIEKYMEWSAKKKTLLTIDNDVNTNEQEN